jgi:hypothetical protein
VRARHLVVDLVARQPRQLVEVAVAVVAELVALLRQRRQRRASRRIAFEIRPDDEEGAAQPAPLEQLREARQRALRITRRSCAGGSPSP